MDQSPLLQQSRPEIFQPKIVHLYEKLFKEEDDEELEQSEGFWEEFFLLKPDPTDLRNLLSSLTSDDLLHLQIHCQHLFLRALSRLKSASSPSDENALDTLTIFLGAVLSKKYTNPSSDIISVLTGLHDADSVFANFVASLEVVIRSGRSMEVRQKAVRTALAMVAGAYQTGLISYFIHRDLFPAIMKYTIESDASEQIMQSFFLLGLLANYNKFEFQNPYRLRLDDFVNEAAIKKVVLCIGATCASARDRYVAVQDDLPENWTIGNTLSYIGLGVLAPGSRPATPTPTAEQAKNLFVALPGSEAGILLSTYDFANANKVFCFNLVSLAAESKNASSPFSSFLSLTSYLFQHAHRSPRSAAYSYLSLYILQILVEDQGLAKRMCGDEGKASVRLCRQRPPFLPPAKGDRVLVTVVLDIMMDGINHNLRRKLDIQFYLLCMGVILRIISFLGRSRIRLAYHWSELWRSLLSFIRFLTTYASDIKGLPHYMAMIDNLVNLVALSLCTSETFLPDPASYDDLFYKVVETGDILTKFRDVYNLSKASSAGSMETLINVSSHYYELLKQKEGSRKKFLTSKEVSGVIKQGYETLSIQAREGLDHWDRFREVDCKGLLKRIARVVVDDGRSLVSEL